MIRRCLLALVLSAMVWAVINLVLIPYAPYLAALALMAFSAISRSS